ncbi:MAG: hypothetical protein DBX39_05305 [Bacillota bacterium]|nr:MAG: hypothetical protein DBX39_05305 [Bacillota bacterium]
MDQKELLEQAKEAKSAEELMSLAKENGMELTKEEAEAYFAQLNKSGELSDEELDNVAGGGCHNKDGRLVVTVWYNCSDFTCKKCGRKNTGDHFHIIDGYRTNYMQQCQFCKYISYEGGLWLCNKPN